MGENAPLKRYIVRLGIQIRIARFGAGRGS
jgi:hypothetical protein